MLFDVSQFRTLRWLAVREFMPWGTPIVVDLSFFLDKNNKQIMTPQVVRRTRTSLNSAIRMNRTSLMPSALHLTNFDEETFRELSFVNADFGLTEATEVLSMITSPLWLFYYCTSFQSGVLCTSRSHLDLFPSDRLVYLSPDSPNDLGYDVCHDAESLSDAIFVVGGLNESPSGMTLQQAEQQGIRHARLPMQKHIGLVGFSNCAAKQCDQTVFF